MSLRCSIIGIFRIAFFRPFISMSWEKEENRSRHVDFQCVKSKRNRFQNIKNTAWFASPTTRTFSSRHKFWNRKKVLINFLLSHLWSEIMNLKSKFSLQNNATDWMASMTIKKWSFIGWRHGHWLMWRHRTEYIHGMSADASNLLYFNSLFSFHPRATFFKPVRTKTGPE